MRPRTTIRTSGEQGGEGVERGAAEGGALPAQIGGGLAAQAEGEEEGADADHQAGENSFEHQRSPEGVHPRRGAAVGGDDQRGAGHPGEQTHGDGDEGGGGAAAGGAPEEAAHGELREHDERGEVGELGGGEVIEEGAEGDGGDEQGQGGDLRPRGGRGAGALGDGGEEEAAGEGQQEGLHLGDGVELAEVLGDHAAREEGPVRDARGAEQEGEGEEEAEGLVAEEGGEVGLGGGGGRGHGDEATLRIARAAQDRRENGEKRPRARMRCVRAKSLREGGPGRLPEHRMDPPSPACGRPPRSGGEPR